MPQRTRSPEFLAFSLATFPKLELIRHKDLYTWGSSSPWEDRWNSQMGKLFYRRPSDHQDRPFRQPSSSVISIGAELSFSTNYLFQGCDPRLVGKGRLSF